MTTSTTTQATGLKEITFRFTINPRSAIPKNNRGAWLAKYGLPPDCATVSVSLPPEEWEALRCKLKNDGTVELDPNNALHSSTREGYLAEAALEIIRETGVVPTTLDPDIARTVLQRWREKKIAEVVEGLVRNDGYYRFGNNYIDFGITPEMRLVEIDEPLPPEHHEWARRILKERAREEEEAAAREAAVKAREAAKEAAKAERKRQEEIAAEIAQEMHKEAISSALGKFGTESQKERFAAGVLPQTEGEDLLRQAALSGIEEFQSYRMRKASEICCCGEVSFKKEDTTEYTAAAWNLRKRVLEKIPDAHIVLTEHTGECNCGTEDNWLSLLVRVRAPHGEVYSARLEIPEA